MGADSSACSCGNHWHLTDSDGEQPENLIDCIKNWHQQNSERDKVKLTSN